MQTPGPTQSSGDSSLGLERAFAMGYPTGLWPQQSRIKGCWGGDTAEGPGVLPWLCSLSGEPQAASLERAQKSSAFTRGLCLSLFKVRAVTKASHFLLKPQIPQPQQPTEV